MHRAERLRARKNARFDPMGKARTRLQELTELARIEEEKIASLRTNVMQLQALAAAHREALQYYKNQLGILTPALELQSQIKFGLK